MLLLTTSGEVTVSSPGCHSVVGRRYTPPALQQEITGTIDCKLVLESVASG